MKSPRIFQVVVAIAVALCATAVGGRGTAPVFSAAVEPTDVSWFETSPGLIRSNLTVTHMDFDPVSGLLYAVSNVDGRAWLRAIDVDLVRVVAETPVGDGRPHVFDIDVSRDGRTVFAATSQGVTSFRRSDLSILRTVPLEDGDPERIDASPNDPERFVVTIEGRGLIGNGGEVIEVVDTVTAPNVVLNFPPRPPFTWGADSDTLYAGLEDVTRLEVADPPVAVAVLRGNLLDEQRELNLTYQNGQLLGQGKLVDLNLTGVTNQVDTVWISPRKDGVGDIMMRTDFGYWALVDGSDLTFRRWWTLPIPDPSGAWVQLSNERFAVLEAAGEGSYLTIGDSRRLGTSYGEFASVQPARILDTRSGVGRGGVAGRLTAGETTTVQVVGRGGLPDDGVLAVVMNATVTAPTASSYFSIWPSGSERPEISNLNFGEGQQIANLVTVVVGEDGAVNLSNEFGAAHALLDVVGYYGDEDGTPGARYAQLDSTERLVDTRTTEFPSFTTLAGDETRTFDIGTLRTLQAARRGEDIVAVALNVTAVRPSETSYFTVWPADNNRPTASSLNFATGEIRANLVVVGVSDDDEVSVYNSSGSVDLLVDIIGIYTTSSSARLNQQGRFLPVEPFRRFDSRVRSPFSPPGSLEDNTSLISSNYQGWTDIWNVTAVRPTADGFLSVLGYDPDDPNTDFPETSNVNFRAGETVANAVYAPGAPDTETYNPFGRTHVVIDVFGYLTPLVQRPIEEVWGPVS